VDNEDFRELAGMWKTSLRNRNLSPDTIRAYLLGVTEFADFCELLGIDPDLTMANAEAYTVSILEADKSASTATLRQLAVKLFSAWLADREPPEIEHDQLTKIKPPKLDQKLVPALTPAEYKALLSACAGKRFVDIRDRALVEFMAATTARADEVTSMRIFDVQLNANSAVIIRGKGAKGRRVGYDDKTAESLGRYIRARKRHPAAESGWLWLADGRGQLSYAALYRGLRRRAARAGVEGFHPHMLRHTAAGRWLRAGGSPLGLKTQGGWQTWSMVERYVGAAREELAVEEAKRLRHED